MEGVSATVYGGLKSYWRRRSYARLNGSGRRRPTRAAELGTVHRRRFWRIKIKAKLRLRLGSPKKLLIWLRDAYVKMMLGFAKSIGAGYGYGGVAVGNGAAAFGKGSLKEYDEKVIVEIYKSLVMTNSNLVPREAGKLGSAVVTAVKI